MNTAIQLVTLALVVLIHAQLREIKRRLPEPPVPPTPEADKINIVLDDVDGK